MKTKTPLAAQMHWPSPMGPMTLAATARGVAGLWFDAQRHHPGPLDAPFDEHHPWLLQAREQLAAYFAGRSTTFSVPLDLHGTPFQQAVWQALLRIPSGGTCTYGAIATALDAPRAVRAVGAAVGRNPVSIIVPCHRVLGHDGGLTGYAGGLDRKRALLQLEAAMRARQESMRIPQQPGLQQARTARQDAHHEAT